jgi:hypothetical protein
MSGDTEFLADATQARIEVQTMDGAAISTLLDDISKTDPTVLNQVRNVIDPASGK